MRGNKSRSAIRSKADIGTNLASNFESEMTTVAEVGAISQMVSGALSLRPRGAMGKDGLVVRNLSARLRMQLLARSIHPWDRDRPSNERNELFVQQCLEDVSIAIPKLFHSMPEIDEMEIVVLDPRSKTPIISGIVKRSDALAANGFTSAGMKLRAMGLAFGRSNSGFERMEEKPVLILSTSEGASSSFTSQE